MKTKKVTKAKETKNVVKAAGFVYAIHKDKEGHKHQDNNDKAAKELRGMDLEDVYTMTAKAVGCTAKELKSRYGKLNPGMQRMNLGNRYRAAMRKEA